MLCYSLAKAAGLREASGTLTAPFDVEDAHETRLAEIVFSAVWISPL
jgi:hypothetical protein